MLYNFYAIQMVVGTYSQIHINESNPVVLITNRVTKDVDVGADGHSCQLVAAAAAAVMITAAAGEPPGKYRSLCAFVQCVFG